MLFVEIGDRAFDPSGATIAFPFDGEGERYAELTASNGVVLDFHREDFDAFMDWYSRCANVSRFTCGERQGTMTIFIKDGKVTDVTELPPNWSAKIKYQNNSGGGERYRPC
ncbi:MAG: hypothetical protein GY832_02470 [Chloroflexi bacterium]|nr:hypothetical protein [Chloroflexota bacterium]